MISKVKICSSHSILYLVLKNIQLFAYLVPNYNDINNMVWFFNIFMLTNYKTYHIFTYMAAIIDPYNYFAYPKSPGQKQYEALRAFYVDKLPAKVVADRFGYTLASFNALRHKFKTRKLTFLFTEKRGSQGSRVPDEVQQRIFEIRRTHNLSS
ncbi:MAG: hypothetical protein H8E17_01375 [Deltaproteobacteria bacterium]|nr:hypothetical protein [Deltaproteobacteria bacterium]